MIRISIYHWLPIADNMLLEIEKRLHALSPHQVNDVEMERDAVTYHTIFNFSRDFRSVAVFPLPGKINQRGFCQHVLTIAPIAGVPLHALLNDLVPDLAHSVSDLLYAIAPDSVRNKLAILYAGVTPFQQFHSTILEPPLEQAVRSFLFSNQVTAILLDERSVDHVRAGFTIPSLGIQVKPFQGNAGAFTSNNGNTILFYSTEFTPDEWTTYDSVIYKYCALVLYARTVDYATSILKQARDHLIPLRRRLVLALQGNIPEHFDALTHMKRYLTYVNIKLPVIQKVIHHLQATRNTQTFAAKIATFDEPIKVFGYPTIRSIESTIWQPPYLIGKIDDETQRFETLFEEDIQEIQIVSSELSQMLEGSLLSEQLRVAQHSLEAAQSMLEIERSTKNLANTNKTVIILLMTAIGMLIVATLNVGIVWTITVGLILFTVGSLVTAFALKRHAAYFRFVIPVRANFEPDALANWISQQKLIKNKTNGNQITCSWQQTIPVRLLSKVGEPQRDKEYLNKAFDVTAEFQRRGFLNAIILEAEHFSADFETRDLIEHVFAGLLNNACLKAEEMHETSLYVRILSLLELPLEERLPALNNLLTLSSAQVSQIVTTGSSNQEDTSLSKLDLHVLQDLNGQLRAYKDWLRDTLENPTRSNLLGLLGPQNVHSKLKLLEQLEEERIKHAQSV
jgi:hypothetical protein